MLSSRWSSSECQRSGGRACRDHDNERSRNSLKKISDTDRADALASVNALRQRLTVLELRAATQADHLDLDHEPVRDTMATGHVSEDQAAVIVKGVDALPVEHRRDAVAHLIGCAAEHDPVALRRLAHHVLEVVAPDIAEAHELKTLQRQEAVAEEACRFTIADACPGRCCPCTGHAGSTLRASCTRLPELSDRSRRVGHVNRR